MTFRLGVHLWHYLKPFPGSKYFPTLPYPIPGVQNCKCIHVHEIFSLWLKMWNSWKQIKICIHYPSDSSHTLSKSFVVPLRLGPITIWSTGFRILLARDLFIQSILKNSAMTQSNSSCHPPPPGLRATNYWERLAPHCEILGSLISFSGGTEQEFSELLAFSLTMNVPFQVQV